MHNLELLIAERIAAGLKRSTLTTPSRWAMEYRVMDKPFSGKWTFKYHPWLREMHDSEAEFNVGQKASQVGYTELALNIAFFSIDVKGIDVLYVLPSKNPEASDFSAARFDAALELSPRLERLFSDVKNVGHKRAGQHNLYIRGSRSRAGLKSIPVGCIILDEVDEMDADNVSLAMERTSGQIEKLIWAISTPTIPNEGINKLFGASTQEHFYFKCPCCSKLTEFVFPQCIEITAEEPYDPKIERSFFKCKECNGRLEHEAKPDFLSKAKWFPEHSDRETRGFYVNRLYSSAKAGRASEIAKGYLKSLHDPSDEQEFYNSALGVPHIVAGAGVTDADIDKCIGGYRMVDKYQHAITTIGIDVGKWLHYEIDTWTIPYGITSTDLNVQCIPKIVKFGKVLHFEELDLLMQQFGVNFGVIDAHPERRKSYEFSSRFLNRVKLCFYGVGIQGKQIHVNKDEENTITVDRTSWLDLSLGRFKNNTITIPIDVNQEYRRHLKAPIRVYEKDKTGNPIGKYKKSESEDDHYAHARNYAELALPFALSAGACHDIGSVL